MKTVLLHNISNSPYRRNAIFLNGSGFVARFLHALKTTAVFLGWAACMPLTASVQSGAGEQRFAHGFYGVHVPGGILVVDTIPDTPAHGAIFPFHLITHIDGNALQPLGTAERSLITESTKGASTFRGVRLIVQESLELDESFVAVLNQTEPKPVLVQNRQVAFLPRPDFPHWRTATNAQKAYVGAALAYGVFDESDMPQAIEILREAANAGNPSAAFFLGHILASMPDFTTAEARGWIEKAADQENLLAMRAKAYGTFYTSATDPWQFEDSTKVAFEIMLRASDLGDVYSQRVLGEAAILGQGMTAIPKLSAMQRAGLHARIELGEDIDFLNRGERDIVSKMRRAASRGAPKAQLWMGFFYENWFLDRPEAANWYAASAQQGNAVAAKKLKGVQDWMRKDRMWNTLGPIIVESLNKIIHEYGSDTAGSEALDQRRIHYLTTGQ